MNACDGDPRRVRVLLAEDDDDNARVAEEILSRLPCSVVAVSDGAAAVDAACAQPFDLLLMDVRMPRMDGLEAARRIACLERRLGRRHAPVVAVTAAAMPGEVALCLQAGMEDVLVKPYYIRDLERVVMRWGMAR